MSPLNLNINLEKYFVIHELGKMFFCIMLQAWIFGQECKYTVTTIELLSHFRTKYVNVSAFIFPSSKISLLVKHELA